jgi:hypothetical protein
MASSRQSGAAGPRQRDSLSRGRDRIQSNSTLAHVVEQDVQSVTEPAAARPPNYRLRRDQRAARVDARQGAGSWQDPPRARRRCTVSYRSSVMVFTPADPAVPAHAAASRATTGHGTSGPRQHRPRCRSRPPRQPERRPATPQRPLGHHARSRRPSLLHHRPGPVTGRLRSSHRTRPGPRRRRARPGRQRGFARQRRAWVALGPVAGVDALVPPLLQAAPSTAEATTYALRPFATSCDPSTSGSARPTPPCMPVDCGTAVAGR